MPRIDNVPLQARLKGLVVNRVDFVGAGSNGESDIAMFKSHRAQRPKGNTMPAPTPVEVAALQKSIDDAVAVAVAKATADAQAAAKVEADKVTDYLKSLAPIEDAPTGPAVDPAIAKAIGDAVAVEKARADSLEAEVRKMQDDAADARYETIAKSMPYVGAEDDLKSLFRGIAKGETAMFEKLEAILTTANERIGKGDLVNEIGGIGVPQGGDGKSRLMNAAKALMDADPTMTLDDAVTKAAKDDPTMAHEYRKSARNTAA